MKVTYTERIMRDRFSCIERDMIIEIDGKSGKYRKKHGSYTEMEIVKG